MMQPSFSNHMPGAVPSLLNNIMQFSGTSACFKFLSRNGLLRLENICLTCARTVSLITSLLSKYSLSSGLVMSSAVGPRPPVRKTIFA
jgi:hypothetical protein